MFIVYIPKKYYYYFFCLNLQIFIYIYILKLVSETTTAIQTIFTICTDTVSTKLTLKDPGLLSN